MRTWIMENLATIVISAVLIMVVAAAVASMVRRKRKGKPFCGCGCAGCPADGCAANGSGYPKKQETPETSETL